MNYTFLQETDIDQQKLEFWQSSTWKKILETSGQAKEVWYFGNISSTYMLVEIRSVGMGWDGAFVLGVTSSQVASDIDTYLNALEAVLREKNILFLQIEPLADLDIPDTSIPHKKFLTPHTRVIDLSLSLDEILAQMHEKGRYNIRLAEKRGVEVYRAHPAEENIDIWIDLLSETTGRDGFSGNSREYYSAFLLSDPGNIHLYFASYQGSVIAAGIWVHTPIRAIYYYGASSSLPEHRKQMAPYLIQWHAIQQAKKEQIPIYDFLGVADPHDPHDPLAGVTVFKSRFGGQEIILPRKYRISLSQKIYLYNILLGVKNMFR